MTTPPPRPKATGARRNRLRGLPLTRIVDEVAFVSDELVVRVSEMTWPNSGEPSPDDVPVTVTTEVIDYLHTVLVELVGSAEKLSRAVRDRDLFDTMSVEARIARRNERRLRNTVAGESGRLGPVLPIDDEARNPTH